MTARYSRSAKSHLGLVRDLTAEETERLRALHRDAPGHPPWTAERAAKRRERDAYAQWLFEDGCSKAAIGEALGFGDLAGDCIAGVSAMLRRAYARGDGTGTRRYIAPPVVECSSAYREMTEREAVQLRAMYEAVPAARSNGRQTGAWTPSAHAFRVYVLELLASDVPLRAVGDVLGVTRERVRQWAELQEQAMTPSVLPSAGARTA